MWMFEEEQGVWLPAFFDSQFGLFLQYERRSVLKPTRLLDQELFFFFHGCNLSGKVSRHSSSASRKECKAQD
jgi:hypothetical protein